MRTHAALALAILCLIPSSSRSEGASASRVEEVLLDAPGGRPIAILLPAAPRKLGEAREGFVRVTLEGWVRLASPSPSTSSPPAARVPVLSGLISSRLPTGEVRFASGARVVILGPERGLEADLADLREQYERDKKSLDERIETLQREREDALNSSSSFREATQRRDRVQADLSARQAERRSLPDKYSARVDESLRRYQIAETAADTLGQYSFNSLPPGRYRILAESTAGGSVRRWYRSVEIPAEGALRFDLAEAASTDPYFATR